MKRLTELADFCVANDKGRCFKDWPRHVLEDYLMFHVEQGTIGYVRHGGAIVAVGIGWQLNESEVREPDFYDKPFQWQASNPDGDSFYFGPLICTRREAFEALIDKFRTRFPQWRSLKLFAGRHGRIVQYDKSFLSRLQANKPSVFNLPGFGQCWERAKAIVAKYRAELPQGVEVHCTGGGGGGPAPRDLYSETAGELRAKLDLAPQIYGAEAQFRPQYAQLDLESLQNLLFGTQAGRRTIQSTEMRSVPGQRMYLPSGQAGPAGFSMVPGGGTGTGWGGQAGFGQQAGAWWEGPATQQPFQVSNEVETQAQPGLADIFRRLQPMIDEATAASLSAQRASEIGDVETLGPRAVQAWRAANPQQQALMDELNRQAFSDLNSGYALSPIEQRSAANASNAAWAGRGLGASPGAAIGQTIAVQEALRRRMLENRAFASGVVGLNAATTLDPFQATLGRPGMGGPQANALLGQGTALSQAFGPQLFGSSINANDVFNTNYNAAAARDISNRNNAAAMQGAYISGGAALGAAGIAALAA